jgi:hypothetical protein
MSSSKPILTAGGELDPKKEQPRTLKDYQLEAYQNPEYFKRMSPYFTEEELKMGNEFAKGVPLKSFNDTYNTGAFFNGKVIYINENENWKKDRTGNVAHERGHARDWGIGTTNKGFDKLQEDLMGYTNPELVKKGKQSYYESMVNAIKNYPELNTELKKIIEKRNIKSGEDLSDTDYYNTRQGEIRQFLEGLRGQRLEKTGGKQGWWDEWKEEDLKNYEDSIHLQNLLKIMDKKEAVKVLNKFANNNSNYNKIFSKFT